MKETFVYDRNPPMSGIEDIGKERYCLSCLDDMVNDIPFLRMKEGYTLVAEMVSGFHGAMTAIWAVPEDRVGEGYEEVELSGLFRPIPTDASDAFRMSEEARIKRPLHAEPMMRAIEGTGSALSYLAASLLARAALDVEASWHGIAWGFYRLLYVDIWAEVINVEKRKRRSGRWNINEDPGPLTPTISFEEGTVTVVFHAYTPLWERRIFRFTDTYTRGNYEFNTEYRVLASSRGGIMV